jgi:hypothetical protein
LITRQFLTRSAPHETGGQAITHSRRWGFSSNPFDIENKSDNGLLPVTPDRLVHLLPIRAAWVREKVAGSQRLRFSGFRRRTFVRRRSRR